MDKAKVLEIIEPSSELDGKTPASCFDARKLRTDSLDDADDFPEKEVCLRFFFLDCYSVPNIYRIKESLYNTEVT